MEGMEVPGADGWGSGWLVSSATPYVSPCGYVVHLPALASSTRESSPSPPRGDPGDGHVTGGEGARLVQDHRVDVLECRQSLGPLARTPPG